MPSTPNAFLQSESHSNGPQTLAVSTSAQVLVGGKVIGVVQSLEPTMDRSTTAVRGIGTGDRILTRVWGLTDYKLSVSKLLLFKQNMIEMFGYAGGFRMLAELRTPIDIHEILYVPVADRTADAQRIRETMYKGCYMTSYGAPRAIGSDIIITETAAFDVTFVYDPNTTADPFGYDSGLNPNQ
jgi:hypothetical protein